MLDHARSDYLGGWIDHAADHARRRQRSPDHAARIDAFDRAVAPSTVKPIEVPVGYAVDSCHERSLRAGETCNLRRGGRKRMRLQGNENVVLRARLLWIGQASRLDGYALAF